jgi:hypothetical protein
MRKRWIFAICAIALMAPVSVVKAQYPSGTERGERGCEEKDG